MRRALVLLALTACTEEPRLAVPDPVVQSHVDTYELYGQFPRTIDVLIVVGDLGGRDVSSFAMTIADRVPTWFGGFTNVRIATTTSNDVLEISTDILGHETRNFSGSLADAIAPRLVSGSSDVLAKMVASSPFSDERHYLGVITITGVDDTSPPADYVTAMKSLKSDPANVVLAGIFAAPSPRLDEFHAAFPNRNRVVSIDDSDYAPALELFASMQRVIIPLPCFIVPDDPSDCSVSAWTDDDIELMPLPVCSDGDPAVGTCWLIEPNANCNYPSAPPRGVTRLRGFWRGWRPKTRWQCAVK